MRRVGRTRLFLPRSCRRGGAAGEGAAYAGSDAAAADGGMRGRDKRMLLSAPPYAQRRTDTILYFGPKRRAGWLMQRRPASSAVLFVAHSFPTLSQTISDALSQTRLRLNY